MAELRYRSDDPDSSDWRNGQEGDRAVRRTSDVTGEPPDSAGRRPDRSEIDRERRDGRFAQGERARRALDDAVEARIEQRDKDLAEARRRGISADAHLAKRRDAEEDGRCAHQLEITRYEMRDGPPDYVGTVKVSDQEKQAWWDERHARVEESLNRFRQTQVSGPDNKPLDPERHRDFVGTSWHKGQSPLPPGDLDKRDELIYSRRESCATREASLARGDGEPPGHDHRNRRGLDGTHAKLELAGQTVPVTDQSSGLRDRYPDGVTYDQHGYPELSRYAAKTVRLGSGFEQPGHADPDDVAARANPIFGWDATPQGRTWHKSGDGHTALLVDTDLHNQFGHADESPASSKSPDQEPGSVEPVQDDSVQRGDTAEAWSDPEVRQAWIDARLSDPDHTKLVVSDEPWARYQREHAGDVEVRLTITDPADQIWVDGLAVDPDRAVAVEAKFVSNPGRSMYEGNVPEAMLDILLEDFDDEMRRYGDLARDTGNPITRIRLVVSSEKAGEFLEERARRPIGDGVELVIQVRPERDEHR